MDPCSVPELEMRRCVLEIDILRYSFHLSQAVYPLWWPSLTKDLETDPPKNAAYSVGVVRQMQSDYSDSEV